MKKKIFRYFSRATLLSIEIVALLTGLIALAGGLFIWRLMSGPFEIGFAKNYIQEALHDAESGYSVSLGEVYVEWPDLRGPILLDLRGTDIFKNGYNVLDVEQVHLGLSTGHLLIGSIEPVSIIFRGPSLNLVRTVDNDVKISLKDTELPPDITESGEDDDGPLMNVIAALSASPGELGKSSPLANLRSVEISDARLVMEDHFLGITWFLPSLDVNFARDRKGLIVNASLDLPGGRDEAAHMQADIIYLKDEKKFITNLHMQDIDPHILSRKVKQLDFLNDHYFVLNGNLQAEIDAELNLLSAKVDLVSENGALYLDGVYDEMFVFEKLVLDASYDKAQAVVGINDLMLKAKNVEVFLSSQVALSDTSINAPLKIRVPHLPQDHIKPLWPDVLKGEGAETWLTEKLSKGVIKDAEIALNVSATKDENDEWKVAANDIVADFFIENMDVDYRAPLWPARGMSGKASYKNDVLSIDIESAGMDDIKVNSGSVVLTNVSDAANGDALIKMDLESSLQSVFRYIANDPIDMGEKELGIKVADTKGQAKLDVEVSFPLIKDLLAEQVKVKVDGELTGVRLPEVVKDMDLTEGPLKLKVADGAASISGKAKLDGRPVDFSWKQYVNSEGKEFSSQVKAKMVADRGLRDKLGIGIEDWVEGSFPVDVVYTEYGGGRSEADVKADLTQATLMAAPFDYEKAPGTEGRGTCKVMINNGNVTSIKNLDVDAPGFRMDDGTLLFAAGSKLKGGQIEKITVGETQLAVDFEVGSKGEIKLSVTGPFLDARPYLKGKSKDSKPYDGPPLVGFVSVERMRTHPARIVDRAKIYFDMDSRGDMRQFELDAVAGRGDIYLRFKPDNSGKMVLRMEADDAGATLQAFGIYENIRGGKLVIYGESSSPSERKLLRGNAQLSDFTVVNAPVLARLLSALSIAGLPQLLGGDGITFARLESEFDWVIRDHGDMYVFREGRTSGSSIGITFEGRIDKMEKSIAIDGTLVPMSMVNSLISSIPIIGDILAGGKDGAVIAATYKVTGSSENPEVSVNPLAALAPGILRKILFEN